MKSDVIGEMERTVMPTVQKLRAPGLVGLSITLDPDAGVATASLIERLAQFYDNQSARSWMDRSLTQVLLLIILIQAIIIVALVLEG